MPSTRRKRPYERWQKRPGANPLVFDVAAVVADALAYGETDQALVCRAGTPVEVVEPDWRE